MKISRLFPLTLLFLLGCRGLELGSYPNPDKLASRREAIRYFTRNTGLSELSDRSLRSIRWHYSFAGSSYEGSPPVLFVARIEITPDDAKFLQFDAFYDFWKYELSDDARQVTDMIYRDSEVPKELVPPISTDPPLLYQYFKSGHANYRLFTFDHSPPDHCTLYYYFFVE